ncbi:MAG: AlkZ-related protein [Pyrinomonadaceae bacterium]
MKTAVHFQEILRTLKTNGFLLESDPKLPSVCSSITGTPLRGSWWSHPLAQIIFQVNEQLGDHDDILIAKLVSRKVTFVHRKLWSELATIAAAREPWQLNGLPAATKSLLKRVDSAGALTTAEIVWPPKSKMKLGDAARDLEKRLLVVGTQFHGESGAHEKRLETWDHWMKQRKFKPAKILIETAKSRLELKLRSLNEQFGASAILPWE